MSDLSIQIGWEYFLGIVGLLIAIAWYSNGRFTALETSMDWVKDAIKELKVNADNISNPAFGSHSPISLNAMGEAWLVESGMQEFIDNKQAELLQSCEEKRSTNPYEVQKHVFKMFDVLPIEPAYDDRIKKFAFEKGTTMEVMRRVGAIYFRNICLERFGMNQEDIDKHEQMGSDT